MYYVQILACLMWIAVQTGSPFGSLGSLRSLASVHVESTCEISSILSLVPDSPNHATCLPDRARRLPDMSPIRHQASLANSMLLRWRVRVGLLQCARARAVLCASRGRVRRVVGTCMGWQRGARVISHPHIHRCIDNVKRSCKADMSKRCCTCCNRHWRGRWWRFWQKIPKLQLFTKTTSKAVSKCDLVTFDQI